MPLSTAPTGRRVIVTGAAGGIGRAIVEALADSGCAVAACDAPGAPVDGVPGAAATATFDVRDRAAVRDGVATAVADLGGCDAVVANAGVVDTMGRAERFSDEAWRTDMETNLQGAFLLAQAAFEPLLASGDGRVVLISSVAAEFGVPRQVAYGIGMSTTADDGGISSQRGDSAPEVFDRLGLCPFLLGEPGHPLDQHPAG